MSDERNAVLARRLNIAASLLRSSSQGIVGNAAHWMKDCAKDCDEASALILTLARTARADEPLTQRKAELAVIEAAREMRGHGYHAGAKKLDDALRSLDTLTGRDGK